MNASLEAQSRPLKGGLAELSVCSGAAERPPFGEEESPSFKKGFFNMSFGERDQRRWLSFACRTQLLSAFGYTGNTVLIVAIGHRKDVYD